VTPLRGVTSLAAPRRAFNSRAAERCDEEKEGSSYWGKVKFDMSDAGRTYTGKWSYCDAEPDTNFQAKWDGK